MDWKAESCFQSSEEERGDEQNTNTSWYRAIRYLIKYLTTCVCKNTWRTVQEITDKDLWDWCELYWFVADTAYSCDPRIKKFKEEEKARKESEKKAKAEAKKREQEEKERVSLILSRSERQIHHMSIKLNCGGNISYQYHFFPYWLDFAAKRCHFRYLFLTLFLKFCHHFVSCSSVSYMCVTGSAGGVGGGSFGEGEGGRGGQAGGPAGQEGEGDPEEGHQEGEAETQDYLQGKLS